MRRHAVIALNVVLLHVAALWALQSGLLQRAVQIIVPAQVISELAPVLPPPTPAPLVNHPHPLPRPVARQAPPAAPTPAPIPAAAPEQAVAAPAVVEAAPAAPVKPAAAPVAPVLELPSSSAGYLQNPKPPYPALSRRLGEQGTVVVKVLIGADGSAQRAEIRSSSGFARLDQTALDTVLRWRFVPGKRNGVPEAMWFNVPINFVLE